MQNRRIKQIKKDNCDPSLSLLLCHKRAYDHVTSCHPLNRLVAGCDPGNVCGAWACCCPKGELPTVAAGAAGCVLPLAAGCCTIDQLPTTPAEGAVLETEAALLAARGAVLTLGCTCCQLPGMPAVGGRTGTDPGVTARPSCAPLTSSEVAAALPTASEVTGAACREHGPFDSAHLFCVAKRKSYESPHVKRRCIGEIYSNYESSLFHK